MSFFHKKMSQTLWAQEFIFGPAKGWPSFQALHICTNFDVCLFDSV